MKGLWIILFSLFLVQNHSVTAQKTGSSKRGIYHAYVTGKAELWRVELDQLESAYKQLNKNEALKELLFAQYGYIALCLKENQKKEASSELDKARENLKILKEFEPDNATLIAVEAAFYGYEMTLSPLKALYLGREAKVLTDIAYSSDPNSLMCLSVKANMLQFSPPIFGGSVAESIEYYNRIDDLYNSEAVSKAYDWNYINNLVILAGAYDKLEMYDKACQTYEKIIAFDSGINWINKKLYPEAVTKRDRSK